MFRSVVLDVDSTLAAIEGIDWLAARRGDEVRAFVADATNRAMRGEIPLESVYAERINAVSPTTEDVEALAQAYISAIEPGAVESLAKLTNSGIRVVLVTGGIRDAILPLARHVGLAPEFVTGVSIYFNVDGSFAGFDTASPLTRNGGKAEVARSLGLEHPVLGVGDGFTDLELKTLSPATVDVFAAYVGVIDRKGVSSVADYVIRNFKELTNLALSGSIRS
ncbi:MAG TPA: HAD-IB family phosphatase [Gemmatimonadaceae bacterium]|nr:HAD-IB family phosphatase [Gemmatimonadaceae bacterium]